MASLLATAGPTLLGKPEFEAMLAAFQRATKEKTRAALTDLVQAARKTKWEEFSEAIGPLAQYAAPECLSAIATEGVTTDEIGRATVCTPVTNAPHVCCLLLVKKHKTKIHSKPH